MGAIVYEILFVLLVSGIVADTGYMKSCGGSKFTLKWVPEALSPNEIIKLSLNGMTSEKFDHGIVNTTIYIKGMTTPLYRQVVKATCNEVLPFAKGFLKKCPVAAGDKIDISNYSYTIPDRLSQVLRGVYTIHVLITNSDGKLFLCMEGDVTVNT